MELKTQPKFVYMFRVRCRRWGFDDIAIVGTSMEQVCEILQERYGTVTAQLIGTCGIQFGESITATFEE